MKSLIIVGPLVKEIDFDTSNDYIGVDYGAYLLLTKNIDMIIAIGDFDSVTKKQYQLIAQKTKIIKLNPIKNESDLDAALQYAINNNYEKIKIIGVIGKRFCHSLININLLYKYAKHSIEINDKYNIIKILRKGNHHLLINKDYPYYSFFSKEDSIISLDGFKYPLTNYLLKTTDTLCLSNEITLDRATVKTNKDIILVQSK